MRCGVCHNNSRRIRTIVQKGAAYERPREVSTVAGWYGRSGDRGGLGCGGSRRRSKSVLRRSGRHDDLPKEQRQCVDQGYARDSRVPPICQESNSVATRQSSGSRRALIVATRRRISLGPYCSQLSIDLKGVGSAFPQPIWVLFRAQSSRETRIPAGSLTVIGCRDGCCGAVPCTTTTTTVRPYRYGDWSLEKRTLHRRHVKRSTGTSMALRPEPESPM